MQLNIAIKKIPIHRTIWTNLQSIMLSHRNQNWKTICSMILFIWNFRKGKTVLTKPISGCQCPEKGLTTKRHKITYRDDKSIANYYCDCIPTIYIHLLELIKLYIYIWWVFWKYDFEKVETKKHDNFTNCEKYYYKTANLTNY